MKQIQNGLPCAKSPVRKPRLHNLIAVLASPRNMTSNKSIWNYLVGNSDMTCLIDTCLFPKEGDLTWGNLVFARIDSMPCFLLPVEVFHFVQVLGAPFSLEGLVGLHRTIQFQLFQHYWLGHRLGLLSYWMVCLGNEQRSFCHFWDCIQVLHFTLFCWLRPLLHFFQGILAHSSRYNGHLS